MNRRRSLLLFAASVLFASPDHVSARQWVSRDGNFKVQADLVRFDGLVAGLQKADGAITNVSVDRLSAEDREFLWTQVDDPRFAAAMSPAVKAFKKAMEGMRTIEVRRMEARLDKLRKELRSGARELKHPVGQQAKALMRHLAERVRTLKSGVAFVPTLSPKDFRVGQIGKLDDDLQFSIRAEPEGDEIPVSITFHELRHTNDSDDVRGFRNSWHHLTVARPDLMYVKADFVDRLPKTHLDRDRKSPANRMLRAHVYEVIELRPRGAAKDYVLTPCSMDQVLPLLTGQAPAANHGAIARADTGADHENGLPDLIISDVRTQPGKGKRVPYRCTVKNIGNNVARGMTTWQAYHSKDRKYDKETDRPAHGFLFPLSGLGPGETSSKNWGYHPDAQKRDPDERYLVFVIDAKNKVAELSEDNNLFVLDTWKDLPANAGAR